MIINDGTDTTSIRLMSNSIEIPKFSIAVNMPINQLYIRKLFSKKYHLVNIFRSVYMKFIFHCKTVHDPAPFRLDKYHLSDRARIKLSEPFFIV